jgi:hypothetical protein
MSAQLPTYEFHPELGYLCPSRQLRQNVRVGLAAAAFGLITGVSGALALLPRHSDNIAWTEPALAGAPTDDAVVHSAPVTGSGPSSLAVASETARRVPVDGIAKQLSAPATIGLGAGAAYEAHPTVEISARAVPPVTSDRAAAAKGTEHGRAVSSKRVKVASSSARRRAREPTPHDSFAKRPVGFQLSPFAYDTRAGDARSARHRDWGAGWSW